MPADPAAMSPPARFAALVVPAPGEPAAPRTLAPSDLPDEGDVLVAVARSSLNYKDALAVTGRGKILRRHPIVPGIDLAGVVLESADAAWRPGDRVIATGAQIGERSWGGLAELARVPSAALVALPEGRDATWAMALGTAGLTAMLAVMALERHGVVPGAGDVVVTGASGGVGGIAVMLLAAAGHRVVASTGRPGEAAYLGALGAAEIIDRSVLATPPDNPLGSARWAGAVDSVGGETLASILATLSTHGSVAACGLAGGSRLHTTVFPFILRGVNLLGIDSNTCPRADRLAAWERLARTLSPERLAPLTTEIGLADVPERAAALLAGAVRGRTVVDPSR